MSSGDWVVVKGALAAESSHAVSGEVEAVSVVDEAVKAGVCKVGSPMTSCH